MTTADLFLNLVGTGDALGMKTFQSLRNQSLLARILFWTGEIAGIIFIIPLLLFVGANLVEELNNGLIIIVSSVAASLSWGFNDISMTLMLLPPMISGILLMIYAYHKAS